jgi:hypothetical protein
MEVRMRRRALLTAAAIMAVLGLLLATSWAGDTKTPPVKTPLQVTYYFLPG